MSKQKRESFHGIMLDNDFDINKFKFQSDYYVHFWTNGYEKGMNLLILLI